MSTCPVCNGKGSYRAPYFSEFHGPTEEDIACVCTERRATFTGLWIVLLFAGFVALVAWVLP